MPEKEIFKTAYIVTVDMGYGHQRAVYPLHDMAQQVPELSMANHGIINANLYGGINKSDQFKWDTGRSIYEKISRLKHLPVVGSYIFSFMDYLQRIEPFYPQRDLSRPTLQVKQIFGMIKNGWGKDLIDKLNKLEHLPFVTSFFTTAFFAEEHNYKGDIYCICTDTDISRAWAPLEPKLSRINYLVPTRRVKERLESYGIKKDKIFITGFPLPKENIGGPKLEILKSSLAKRIVNLDTEGRYRSKYKYTMTKFLGTNLCSTKFKSDHPLTITFAVGGAGAQRELGAEIAGSLREEISKGKICLNLVSGIRNDVFRYYQAVFQDLGLSDKINKNIFLIYSAESKFDYFSKFNSVLNTTDILWSKPSELSFYAGLGLPIIIAPTIGSQEEFNKDWLTSIGAGVMQEDPRYTNEWLKDWLASGWLADAAMNGFLNAPRNGTYHVEDIVLRNKRSEIEDMHLF